jgi:hypothetical protein
MYDFPNTTDDIDENYNVNALAEPGYEIRRHIEANLPL